MFGLGPTELLLILAVIALVGGPKAVKKIVGLARQANNAKNELTSKAIIDRVLEDEPKPKKKRRKKRA
jgi:Sec-independent protein translocase protein TatA